MAKKIIMTLLLGSFLIVGGTSAQEAPKKMSPSEEENLKKMMLLKEHMKNMGAEHPDVHGHIGETLHSLSSNPVLDGTLEYTNPQTKEKVSFKIGTKVKDGMIDLSDKAFGDAAKYLVITIDPSVFFANHGDKLVFLIAPWSLIHDNLSSPSCAPFQPIMKNWDEKEAPIGFFWRKGSWSDKSLYDYNIKLTIEQITEETFLTIFALTFLAHDYPNKHIFLLPAFKVNFDLK